MESKAPGQRYTVDEVIDAIHQGHTPTGAASVLHCHPDTVRNYADRYVTVKQALLSERAALVDLAELGLRGALLKQEAWAIAFSLRTLARDVYSDRTEITGKDGSDVTLRVVFEDKNA